MSNDNFQTPVTCGTHSGKGTAHKDEGETYSNASPGMTNSQSVCPRLDISGVPQPTHSDDTDAHSSGNDSAERESEGHMGREASTCSSHNGKGSTTETTESKSSNGNSPSPPSSSVSFSLLSGSSEQDQPTSQAPSGDQPARLETQGELLKALRELKVRMPPEWRRKGRSSTLASLQYALSCVKQVRANQEYYHQWSMEESHGCCLDLSSFTIEELDNITSEYTLQNTDTFSVAVSFLSGKVVYISSQAAPLLRCKPKRLQGAVFLELLAPQDISTFYSSTAPCHLPPWSSCAGTSMYIKDFKITEKSMFCRISRGRDSDGDVKYYPFRLTPYQLTLRDSDTSQPEPCCLLITERVHSGYEAPRIPADKRIFTTSHTPNCLFQEIDERAVPLLGYLPQDLVGKPVLIYLHPEDRLLMVATHKKILQFAGQPFNHSPLRMRARSGEYLTLDTSWSSFINPWSRKVAFIVGRHKVRTSPLNEDVFTALEGGDVRTMSPDVPQLNELIHRVLVQPVHASSSQGYGSLGSSGSNEHQQSTTSSSESNGHASEDQIKPRKPMTFEQICQDMHMVKTNGQQVFIDSRNRPPALKKSSLGKHCLYTSAREGLASLALSSPPRKELPIVYSYQQINCLDSIIRYLGSFNVPGTVKRKCGSSACTTSSTSDDDKQREGAGATEDIAETLVVTEGSKVVPAAPAHPLTPLALHCKAESVASATSQCSFSSTIVHVGDKKPPESDIVMMEEPPTTPTPSTSQAMSPTAAVPEKEKEKERRSGGNAGKGLTKAVLSAHTQQEEQAFLNRFRDINHLRMVQPSGPPQRRHTSTPGPEVNESNQDAMSTSSDMLDLLLQEDSRSGTGSAASGSGSSGSGSGSGSFGSGSNGCSTSGSGTRSSNTSKYFGSIDSSENDHNHKPASKDLGGEQFIKFVLQDPIWLLMANTDDKVMMTYQIPIKDRESVLKEDRDALKAVQKHQPHFTEEQKKELTQVHPWFQTGCLPKAINVTVRTERQSGQRKHIVVGHGGGGSDIMSEGEVGLFLPVPVFLPHRILGPSLKCGTFLISINGSFLHNSLKL
uniref:Period circadian protein homolog 1-like n=1 Tax=Sinocyclocheilus anshuiensis TaxID=1608454 RepID=A0A671QED7_9TELE